MTNIVWFRNDLRISDNPALFEASKIGKILPIYILDDDLAGNFKLGGASRLWLHHSLNSLNKSLGGNLNIYSGNSEEIIFDLIKRHKVNGIFLNRCYEPFRIDFDSSLKRKLEEQGVNYKSFNASLLWEPWEALKPDKTPYKVFTPFYKNCLKTKEPRKPFKSPESLDLLKDNSSLEIAQLNLLPKINWHKSIENQWKIGEENAQERLLEFIKNGLENYQEGRNVPSKNSVSRLSPHLRFGEISPNQIWREVEIKLMTNPDLTTNINHFLMEIGWREFSYNLLYYFRDLPSKNFNKKFDKFPWRKDADLLNAWQKGETGYPIIDAGMRELWQTGYMHNRVRMIVGSFLVKNLLIDWRDGEQWFWDCLLDADLASNSASWQWIAGSGADAAPYFRIFNPVLQGEKFDADGIYTKQYVPELSNLPSKFLFKPWEAPELVLKEAGIELGKNYPKPIVDISESRNQALLAYKVTSK